MSSKFNIVSKPKKIETEEEEETELEEEQQKQNDQAARKKMVKYMIYIMVGFVVIILIVLLISLFVNKKYTYEEIENVLKEAAVEYFEVHKDKLPQEDGYVVEVDAANLSVEEMMKPLSEYTEEGVTCSGNVQVQKVGEEYVYIPYLNCGESYTTIELYNQIIQNEPIVTTGYGLYNVNGNYVYRGENINNYIQLEKQLWRIVKITPSNNLVLILEELGDNIQPWDDRYNKQALYTAGLNSYNTSRIKEILEKMYSDTKEEEFSIPLLSNNDRAKIVPHDLCIGKRAANQQSKNGEVECKETIQNQKIGLLPLYDYMNASIDADCTTPESKSCQNYNYLVKEKTWWTITGDTKSTYDVYQIRESGKIESNTTSNYANIRPVIYLNNKVMYKEGNGTSEKPYIIK